MLRNRRHAGDEAPGQDSFLDIVANLVGILIILVMVVGVRAKDAMVKAEAMKEAAEATAPENVGVDVAAAEAAAAAVQADIHSLAHQLQSQRATLQMRRSERDQIHVLITTLQKRLDQQRDQLDTAGQQHFDIRQQLASAREELDDLQQARAVAEQSTAPVAVLEHLPTPMVKTVFGKEVHFRLLKGRVTFVPWEELVERLKAEAPQKIWKLKEAPQITETLGPEQGFRMRYTLRRVDHALETRIGTAVQRGIELEQFVLVPVRDDLGEPLTTALQTGSQFRAILAGLTADRTTITVWVYPDSFQDFRTLKRLLMEQGFQVASRPLPEGQSIGGAPGGSRSVAQ